MKLKYLLHFFIALFISGIILALGSLTRATSATHLMYIFIGSLYLGAFIHKRSLLWGFIFPVLLIFILVPLYHDLFDMIDQFSMRCNSFGTCYTYTSYNLELSVLHLILGPLGALLGSKLKKLLKK